MQVAPSKVLDGYTLKRRMRSVGFLTMSQRSARGLKFLE